MVFENKYFFEWVKKSIDNIDEELAPNYYHTLDASDNSPTIIHHNTAQCTVVIKGEGFTEISGKEYSIKTGSIILANAGESHKFWTNSQPLVLFHIHIPFESIYDDRSIVSGNDFKRH